MPRAPGQPDLDYRSACVWSRLARRSGFRLQDLVQMSGLSQRQVRRYIHQLWLQTLEAWLNDERMSYARAVLLEKRCVKTAAFELGFKQPSHFCRMFKARFAMTPTQFLLDFDKRYGRRL